MQLTRITPQVAVLPRTLTPIAQHSPRFAAETPPKQDPKAGCFTGLIQSAIDWTVGLLKRVALSVVEAAEGYLKKAKEKFLPPLEPGEVRSLFKTRFIELCLTKGRANGIPWMFVRSPIAKHGAAVIIPIHGDKLVIIEQARPPVQDINGKPTKGVIEFPAGMIGDVKERQDETAIGAAEAELEEETGFKAKKFTYMGSGASSPGMSSEMIHYVKAEGLTKVSDNHGIPGEEDIIVHEVPLENIDQWIRDKQADGYVINCSIYSGLGLLRGSQPTEAQQPTDPTQTA